jgi:hypothetical protein
MTMTTPPVPSSPRTRGSLLAASAIQRGLVAVAAAALLWLVVAGALHAGV